MINLAAEKLVDKMLPSLPPDWEADIDKLEKIAVFLELFNEENVEKAWLLANVFPLFLSSLDEAESNNFKGAGHVPNIYWRHLAAGAGLTNNGEVYFKQIVAACPVDVNVQDKTGTLVAGIKDDVVTANTLPVEVKGDAKSVWMYGSDDEYDVKITATDDGVMDFMVIEYDYSFTEVRRIIFNDVSLNEGNIYTAVITTGESLDDTADYFLTVNNDSETDTIQPDKILTDNEFGAIKITVNVVGDGIAPVGSGYTEGDLIDLLAVANEGSEFLGWYENSTRISGAGARYYFTATSNRALEARFTQSSDQTYTITASAGTGVSVTGGGTYVEDSTVILTATPTSNYKFNGWYENNTMVSSAEAAYTFTATANRTLEARFAYTGGSSGSSGSGGSSRSSSSSTDSSNTLYSLTLNYQTDDGTEIVAQKISLKMNDSILLDDLDIPDGYELVDDDFGYTYTGDSSLTIKIRAIETAAETVTQNVQTKPTAKLDKANAMAYISGYSDGTIRPKNNITRAEVAMVFYTLVYDEKKSSFTQEAAKFQDVGADKWYSDAVGYLSVAGIISGYGDGSFRPNNEITRAEFATIASQFGTLNVNSMLPFTDVSNSHWAYSYIASVYGNGWISGYPDASFKPDNKIIRAEVITVVNRMLVRDVSGVSGSSPFTDLSGDKWYYKDVLAAAAVE